MASPFAKYQSEQVQQIAPGFVEAFGRAGASLGQGIAGIGAGVGKAIENAEQKKIEEAKLQGAVTPYLRSEVANVQRSIENGLLQVGKDGKVSITPGQEANLDANKVGRAIDLYNQTDGGKKEMKAADLAGVISTIQSYDTLEKQAAERVAAAGAAQKAKVELSNSILEGRVKKFTLTKGASDALLVQAKQAQDEADALASDPSVPLDVIQQRYAMAAGLKNQALKIVTDSFADEGGLDISAYAPQQPARPPVTPGAVPMGLDVSSLQTVSTPVPSFGAAPAGLDFSRFDSLKRAGSAPAPSALTAGANSAASQDEVAALASGLGMTKAGLIEAANRFGVTPQEHAANVSSMLAARGDGNTPAPAASPAQSIKPAAPAAKTATPVAQAPAAVKPAATAQPVSPQNLLTGKMPKQAVTPPAVSPPAAGTAAVAPAPTVGLQSQTANEIITRQAGERRNYLNANAAIENTLRSTPGLPASSREGLRKTIEANKTKITAIDKLITDQTAIIAEQSKAESAGTTAKAASTSEQRQLVGTFEKGAPMAGGGWMYSTRANAMEALNRGEIKSLEEAALTTKFGPQFQGSFDDVKDTLSSLDGFMKAAIATDKAIDKRLASGDQYLDRLAFTSKDFTTLATGNVAEKMLLANMRKAIVSGGNFSDQDRKFILEAVASINTLDPTKGAKYFKDLNKVMAQMAFSMYADKLSVAGFVNRPDLTGDDKSAMNRVRQDFETRFGTGTERATLEALIEQQYGKAKPSEVSALGAAIEEFATAPAKGEEKKK